MYLKFLLVLYLLVALVTLLVLVKTDVLDGAKYGFAYLACIMIPLAPLAKLAINLPFSGCLLIVFIFSLVTLFENIRDDIGKIFAFKFAASIGLMQLVNYLLGFELSNLFGLHLYESELFDQPWMLVMIIMLLSVIVGLARPQDQEKEMRIFQIPEE